ncbi:hypothetical protein D1872_287870 [compost metagenome]
MMGVLYCLFFRERNDKFRSLDVRLDWLLPATFRLSCRHFAAANDDMTANDRADYAARECMSDIQALFMLSIIVLFRYSKRLVQVNDGEIRIHSDGDTTFALCETEALCGIRSRPSSDLLQRNVLCLCQFQR